MCCLQGTSKAFVAGQRPPRATRLVSNAGTAAAAVAPSSSDSRETSAAAAAGLHARIRHQRIVCAQEDACISAAAAQLAFWGYFLGDRSSSCRGGLATAAADQPGSNAVAAGRADVQHALSASRRVVQKTIIHQPQQQQRTDSSSSLWQ